MQLILSRLHFIGLVKCKTAVSDLRGMNTHCVAFNVGGSAAGLFTPCPNQMRQGHFVSR